MLQAYSLNLAIAANTFIPLNNLVVDKGCAEKLSAPATIELEKRGVYYVEVNGFGTGAAAGANTIQLYRNGVALPSAQDQFTTAANEISNFSFNTLIQVQENNCPCNCTTNPVTLQIMNGEQALTDGYVNVVVTKLC